MVGGEGKFPGIFWDKCPVGILRECNMSGSEEGESVTVWQDPYPFPWSRDTKHVTSMHPQHNLLAICVTSQG